MEPIDSLSAEILLSEDLYQEFAYYLCVIYRMDNGDPLKSGSVLQYLGAIKTYAVTKFKSKAKDFFHPAVSDWYSDLRRNAEKKVANVFIAAGMNINDKSPPIGRNLMISMGDTLLKYTNLKEGVERRAALVMLYLACGRGGEIGNAVWNNTRWDITNEYLVMYWSESKTSDQKLMTFHVDRLNFEIDVIHSLACYFIFGAGTHYLATDDIYAQWIFPIMNGLKNGCSSKTTTYIRDLVPDDSTVHSSSSNKR